MFKIVGVLKVVDVPNVVVVAYDVSKVVVVSNVVVIEVLNGVVEVNCSD